MLSTSYGYATTSNRLSQERRAAPQMGVGRVCGPVINLELAGIWQTSLLAVYASSIHPMSSLCNIITGTVVVVMVGMLRFGRRRPGWYGMCAELELLCNRDFSPMWNRGLLVGTTQSLARAASSTTVTFTSCMKIEEARHGKADKTGVAWWPYVKHMWKSCSATEKCISQHIQSY